MHTFKDIAVHTTTCLPLQHTKTKHTSTRINCLSYVVNMFVYMLTNGGSDYKMWACLNDGTKARIPYTTVQYVSQYKNIPAILDSFILEHRNTVYTKSSPNKLQYSTRYYATLNSKIKTTVYLLCSLSCLACIIFKLLTLQADLLSLCFTQRNIQVCLA